MGTVCVTRAVDAPRERVWAVYTDHVSWQDWSRIGKVRLEREGTPTANGVGCVRVISSYGVSVHEEILSFDPPSRMTYRVVRGGIPIKNHLGEVVFDEDAVTGATIVRWSCRFDSKIPGLDFLWRWIVEKVFRDTLDSMIRNRFPPVAE